MIWGLALQPGHEYTEIFEEETHLSMATLECRPGKFSEEQPSSYIVVRTLQGEYLLCFLEKGTTPQQSLDLVLQPQEEVTFCVEGTATIFITGYTASVYTGGDGGHSQAVELSETSDKESFSNKEYNEIVVKTEEETTPEGEEADGSNVGGVIIVTVNSENEVEDDKPDVSFASSHFDVSSQSVSTDVISECSEEEEPNGFNEGANKPASVKSPRDDLALRSEVLQGGRSTVKSSDSETLTCHICSKTFLSLETRQQHALNAHRETIVSHDTKSFRELTSEAQTDLSTTDSNLVCQPGTSQNVRRDVDPDRNCRVQYSWNSSKRSGLRYTDGAPKVILNKKKIHKCQYCHKMFDGIGNRKAHERIHTGERPFKCRFCPQGFGRKSHCIIHERRHTGEKPFRCKFCEWAFADSSNYNAHVKTHTGETPYHCRICHKGFSRRFSCQRHENSHMGEKY